MRSVGECASASRRCLAGPRRQPAFARPVTVAWSASAGSSRSPPRPTISSGWPSWWEPWRSHGRTLSRFCPAPAQTIKIDPVTCLVTHFDLNKARMRRVIEALLALSSSPNGFTASEVAARVRALSKQSPSQYGPRHAAYDLKKLRGKHIIRRIGHTRRYEPLLTGLRAMTALLVLRDKAIKPLLAAAQPLRPKRGAHNPKPITLHYDAIQAAMKGVFHELGLAA